MNDFLPAHTDAEREHLKADITANGLQVPLDVFRAGKPEKDWHEYQQSLESTRKLVEQLSKPGDLVVDACMGTGTTALACLTADRGPRRFVGCDRDEDMYKSARMWVDEYLAVEKKRHEKVKLHSPQPGVECFTKGHRHCSWRSPSRIQRHTDFQARQKTPNTIGAIGAHSPKHSTSGIRRWQKHRKTNSSKLMSF